MAVTKSWDSNVALKLEVAHSAKPVERRRELFWLTGASLVVACGLAFVFISKTQDFPELQERLNQRELLNLNETSAPQQLLPALQIIPSDERDALEWRFVSQIDEVLETALIGYRAGELVHQGRTTERDTGEGLAARPDS